MFLKEIEIRNYRVHQDTKVSLLPLTVFVGPNGGGKSALFDGLLNFSILARGNLKQAFGPFPFSFYAALYRGAASKVARIGYRVLLARSESDADYLDYEIDYAQDQKRTAEDQPPSFTIFAERLRRQPSGDLLFDRAQPDKYPLSRGLTLEHDRAVFSSLRQSYAAGTLSPDTDELALYCAQQVSRFNKFRLDANILSVPSRMPEIALDGPASTVPRLGYRGEDLAATLYYMSETKSPVIEQVKEWIKTLDRRFQGFEFNHVGADRVSFSAVYSDARKVVPSVLLSSGMLSYLGLIVLVASPERPPVLMIEEPENGLTPQAVKSFYRAVRGLAYNEDPKRRSQVLLSSHSPFVICEAWNGEDRDFIHQVKVVNGKAEVRKFSVVVQESEIQLAKDNKGKRTHLSLQNAEEIMSGYLAGIDE